MLLLLLACVASSPDSGGAGGDVQDGGVQDSGQRDSGVSDSGTASLPPLTVVTFNTGTSEGMGHDASPDDGYTGEHALISDQYYGDGLAWVPAVQAAADFLADVQPDVIGFQEIFFSGTCPDIPEDAWPDFVCEDWEAGDPTVAQVILGAGYQVACHPGKDDKCLAVHASVGTFAGCDQDFCLEGLGGGTVEGCGSGSRVGRGEVIDAEGNALFTVVNVHGSSGVSADDEACRVAQVEQVFVDLGDGRPAADGARNIVLGDLNTDPGRFAGWDDSAVRWNDFVGDDQPFWWISPVGPDAPGSYQGIADIDHVASDTWTGSCWHAGLDGHPAVIDAVYFDHVPVVCALE